YSAEVGSKAPEFELKSQDGKVVKLSDYKGKTIVLEWTNPGCPFVKAHYDSEAMQKLQSEITAKGVIWLQINSSAAGHEGYLATPIDAKTIYDDKKMKSTA
ncbi:MAG: redoxin domain-containing protein, partial [Verrucomicrobiota bacterium]